MIYPEFLKANDTIGITAISKGIYEDYKLKRLDQAIDYLKNQGFNVIETPNVRKMVNGRSSTGLERANEFMDLWKNDNVKAIIMASGGDYALEMLEYLPFDEMKKYKPKWIQGFSDVTTLGYLFPTYLDISTIYADNVINYGMKPIHISLEKALKVMMGEIAEQVSYDKYQDGFLEYGDLNPYEPYSLTKNVEWKNLKGEDEINFKGRAIGGCLDIISNFIGTKYDKIKEFNEKYKDDGIIWFLEVFDLASPQVYWYLWRLKNAGYFDNCKGVIFGRTAICREDYGITFKDSLMDIFNEMDIPVIYDADFGHRPPQIAMLNGGVLEITSKNGKGKIYNFFK